MKVCARMCVCVFVCVRACARVSLCCAPGIETAGSGGKGLSTSLFLSAPLCPVSLPAYCSSFPFFYSGTQAAAAAGSGAAAAGAGGGEM